MASQKILEVIRRYWGYTTLRPLQAEAMEAVLQGRDSLVVLPTGGGKSLCYQAPAAAMQSTTAVISPLISLMKDQVDGLTECGIPAARLDSSISSSERSMAEALLRAGRLRLVFVSPEKLIASEGLLRSLREAGCTRVAIDEAHCISHWGHDFRPEYRQLARLREVMPEASFHAFTATATERVRRDICAQLSLRDPVVLVGDFCRPNLIYRVWPRHSVEKQVMDFLSRHPGEAGIIYCKSRRDVDLLAEAVKRRGVKAVAYHAGLDAEVRQAAQDAFAKEQADVVVATIAFGMGIDRSNVRFVLHVGLPKSLENYQQETGRAGRDGLEAECALLYSGGDVAWWKSVLARSAAEAQDSGFLATSLRHLEDMDRYARGAVCRHKALVEYFGQKFPRPSCGACDLCLGDFEEVPDSRTVAQKLLSCVARVKESFGIGHVINIVRGKASEAVLRWGHQKLSTFGILSGSGEQDLRDWLYQLIGQGALAQTEDEYPRLRLTDASWEVMRGQRDIRLVRLARRKKGEKPAKASIVEVAWEGVDPAAFNLLREWRRNVAIERAVPAYVIFTDNTLRELARRRPRALEDLKGVPGIGEAKLREYGAAVIAALAKLA
jgi:ATP-dependent DNA helicase RecQ